MESEIPSAVMFVKPRDLCRSTSSSLPKNGAFVHRRQWQMRRQSCRSACSASDKVRIGYQPEDRQGTQVGYAGDNAGPRRRSDRMSGDFRVWHETVMAVLSPHLRCWGMNGTLGDCRA